MGTRYSWSADRHSISHRYCEFTSHTQTHASLLIGQRHCADRFSVLVHSIVYSLRSFHVLLMPYGCLFLHNAVFDRFPTTTERTHATARQYRAVILSLSNTWNSRIFGIIPLAMSLMTLSNASWHISMAPATWNRNCTIYLFFLHPYDKLAHRIHDCMYRKHLENWLFFPVASGGIQSK